MNLKLNLNSPEAYVRAVSGLFISKKHPLGLTQKEIKLISKLIEHSPSGVVTFSARKKTMDEFALKPQNLYNTMTILRSKGVFVEDELHKVFTSSSLTVSYGA